MRKYDLGGGELWNRRFGGSTPAAGVAVNASAVYVVGSTDGALPGQRSAGEDAFVRKYDAGGNELWTRQFGASGKDIAYGVAADAAGVYVVGQLDGGAGTSNGNAFVRKYDPDGVELWTRRFTTPRSLSSGVSVDATGVYVVGYALPDYAMPDGNEFFSFLRKYDHGGTELWTRPDKVAYPRGVPVDATGVYFVAWAPGIGAFVRKYDVRGEELWTRPLGRDTGAAGAAVDATGIYVAGAASSALPGQCWAGDFDVFVRKLDPGGNELWTRQFGTLRADGASGVAADATGVYVARFRADRAFLAKLGKMPATVTESRPRIQWECILNAASYLGGGGAPGEIVTIFGSGMGPLQLTPLRVTEERRLATTLADTRILFNGVAAPLVYVSEKQSSAIVPYALAGRPSVDVQVEYQGVRSDTVTVPVLETRLGVFTLDGSGRGPVAILNEDGSLNSSSHPAPRGSVVAIYATGEGQTNPPGVDGLILGGALPRATLPVSAILGDCLDGCFGAEVRYAGGVSGSVAGLLQVNVRLPREMSEGPGLWSLALQIGPESTYGHPLVIWVR